MHVTVTVTASAVGGPMVAFSSRTTREFVTSIYVKGGNTANLYTYPAPARDMLTRP